MKRKLNNRDVPLSQSSSFSSLGLDSRLLQAIVEEKYSRPTSIQAKAIPLALEGKDILGKL